MKRSLMVLLVVLLQISSTWAATLGDINNDGKVGLPEAIYSLQVSSGERAPQEVAGPTYDLRDYFFTAGKTYIYRETKIARSPSVDSQIDYQYSTTAETVNGIDVLALIDAQTEFKKYYTITVDQVGYIGGYSYNGTNIYNDWYDPPFTLGSNMMKKGDTSYLFYRVPAPYYPLYGYSEMIFLGLEDVTVPAGTFLNCLKVLKKDVLSPSSAELFYYAKGIGLVKVLLSGNGSIRPFPVSYGNMNGYMRELVATWNSGTPNPVPPFYCKGQGTWTKTLLSDNAVTTGSFTVFINTSQRPTISATISLQNYSMQIPIGGDVITFQPTVTITSTDGMNFSIAGPNPELTYVAKGTRSGSITLNNNLISGTVTDHLDIITQGTGTIANSSDVDIISFTGTCGN